MNQQRYLDPDYSKRFRLEHLIDAVGASTTEQLKHRGEGGHADFAAAVILGVEWQGTGTDAHEIY